MAVGAFGFGGILFDLAGGILGDRYGPRVVGVVGCSITAAGAVGAGLVASIGGLILMRAVQGIGAALYMTTALSVVVGSAPHDKLGKTLSLYQGTVLVALTIGPLFGGVLASLLGLRAPFFAYALLAASGAVISLVVLPDKRNHDRAGLSNGDQAALPGRDYRRKIWRLLKTPTFALALTAAIVSFFARSGIRSTIVPLFAHDDLGFDEVAIGTLLTIGAIANALTIRRGGKLLDRRGRKPVILWSTITTGAAVMALSLVASGWMLFVLVSAIATTTGFSTMGTATVAGDLAHSSIRGTAVGMTRMTTDIALMIGPVTAGWASDSLGYRQAFLVLGLAIAMVGASMGFMTETREAPPSP